MAVIFIRTLIIFITLVIVMRLMGKRQIGEMQPYEFIVTLIIADSACVPMADVSIPLVYGIVSALALFLLHQIMSLIESFGNKGKFIVSGKPSVVIDKNGVNIYELNKNNMSVADLIESMRALGYFSLEQASYAIFETNGKLSVLQNEDYKKTAGLSYLIINKGKVNDLNLQKIGYNKTELKNFLTEENAKLKNTEVFTVDQNGQAYLKIKNKKYRSVKIPIKEEYKW